jgi:hypothetical protein
MKKKNNKQKEVLTLKVKSAGRQRGVIFLRSTHWTDQLSAQEELCRNFCGINNIEVVDIYNYLGDNVAEPARFNSWGIAPILEECESHKGEINVLVVASRACLGTNTADYLKCKVDLLKVGVEILSVTDIESADSSLEEICEIVAEYERGNKKST